jgi:HK97 family phage major capsid protein
MEIEKFVKATELVPLAELTTIAATRGAFGDDVLTAFKTQIELRTTEAQKVLDLATAANRDTLLASEQRSYDGHVRERDAVLSLQLAIEKRTEQRAHVPESQHDLPGGRSSKNRAGALFGLELRALAGSATPGSVISPDEWSANFIDRLAAESVMLKAGIRRITTSRDALHLPRIDSDPTAAFYAEGGTITPSDPGYTDIVATPRKLASLQTISNELIADSNPDVISLLEMQTARSLALAFDLACLEGSGTAPSIRGLKNTAGITVDSSLTAAPVNLDVFATAIATLETNNAHATAIVMHPRSWGELSKIKQGTSANNMPLLMESAGSAGQAVQRSIYGVPVFLSSQMSLTEGVGGESSAYVFEAAQLIAVFRQDTTITLDRSRLFNTDQSELRAILRADFIVPNPLAVVHISKIV